jgi:hypothetical protein
MALTTMNTAAHADYLRCTDSMSGVYQFRQQLDLELSPLCIAEGSAAPVIRG